jgi:hypothetical protein
MYSGVWSVRSDRNDLALSAEVRGSVGGGG